jgi:hypothetical protein
MVGLGGVVELLRKVAVILSQLKEIPVGLKTHFCESAQRACRDDPGQAAYPCVVSPRLTINTWSILYA